MEGDLMKPIIIAWIATVAFLLLPGRTLGQHNLLKNGDFESFTGGEPNRWNSNNIPKALTVVSPSTKCHGGKNAVKCEVKDFYGSKFAGMIMQKNIEISGDALQLSGYYVLGSVGKDVGFISIELQNAEGSTVKLCQENLLNPAPEFTRFLVTGNIPNSAVRLDIKLTLLPGKGSETLHEGSYILFDDLDLVQASPEGEKKKQ
jgi:hypothetical protein